MNDSLSFLDGDSVISSEDARIDLGEMFDSDRVLKTKSSEFWMNKACSQKCTFGHTFGLSLYPTYELVARLQDMIMGRSTIEIGAGNGGLARALGIIATDSFSQNNVENSGYNRQPKINYGIHVDKLEATMAVAVYKPEVVISSWVMHLYDPLHPFLGGSVLGVAEQNILDVVDDYIFIGNTAVHSRRPLLHEFNEGRVATHYVKEFIIGESFLQSSEDRGGDFITWWTRV